MLGGIRFESLRILWCVHTSLPFAMSRDQQPTIPTSISVVSPSRVSRTITHSTVKSLSVSAQYKLLTDILKNGGLKEASQAAIYNREPEVYGQPGTAARKRFQNKVNSWKKLSDEKFREFTAWCLKNAPTDDATRDQNLPPQSRQPPQHTQHNDQPQPTQTQPTQTQQQKTQPTQNQTQPRQQQQQQQQQQRKKNPSTIMSTNYDEVPDESVDGSTSLAAVSALYGSDDFSDCSKYCCVPPLAE